MVIQSNSLPQKLIKKYSHKEKRIQNQERWGKKQSEKGKDRVGWDRIEYDMEREKQSILEEIANKK